MVVIVLEGANCIGKSTTCDYLKGVGFQYIHFPSSSQDYSKGLLSKWIYQDADYTSIWGDMFRSESIESIYRHGYAKLDILTNLKPIIQLAKTHNIVIDRMSLSNSLYNSGSDKMKFTDMIYNIMEQNNIEFKVIVLYTNDPSILRTRLIERNKDCEYTRKNIDYIDKTNTYINSNYKSLPVRDYLKKICVDNMDAHDVYSSVIGC